MPNCLQLFRKPDGTDPISLAKVDEEICAHMGVQPHPMKCFLGWYDWIGYWLAVGKDWDFIRERTRELGAMAQGKAIEGADQEVADLLKVIDFMEATYNTGAWYEVKA